MLAPLHAQNGKSRYDPYLDPHYFYMSENQPPIEELLGEEDLNTYKEALDAGDCDPAFALLLNAYARVFPEEPHPGWNARTRFWWYINVGMDLYPDVCQCNFMRDIRETSAEIARLSEEGKAIRFTSQYQYYLAMRARHLGLDSAELDDLIRATEKRLDPNTIPWLRRRAHQNKFEPYISQYR